MAFADKVIELDVLLIIKVLEGIPVPVTTIPGSISDVEDKPVIVGLPEVVVPVFETD